MTALPFKIAGIIGLLLITTGVLTRKRKHQDVFYFIGGVFLLSYSLAIRDWIFIILQLVFICATVFDWGKR